MKNIIKDWLKRLEASNKESFGTGRLDCCELGREKKVAKSTNTTENK